MAFAVAFDMRVRLEFDDCAIDAWPAALTCLLPDGVRKADVPRSRNAGAAIVPRVFRRRSRAIAY
jgi:hypothetical protein